MSAPPGRKPLTDWLAAVAVGDAAGLAAVSGPADDNIEQSGLDMRTHALVRLAAQVAVGEPGTTYDQHVATALDHGVTRDEILGVLVALLPTLGTARITAAAAGIAGALGRAAADPPADPPAMPV